MCLLRSTNWIFICFVWIWDQTEIISLYSINCLVCITETDCVYCAVCNEYSWIIHFNFHLKIFKGGSGENSLRIEKCVWLIVMIDILFIHITLLALISEILLLADRIFKWNSVICVPFIDTGVPVPGMKRLRHDFDHSLLFEWWSYERVEL